MHACRSTLEDPTDLEILPGVADALQRLRNAGFLNVVITNQPDVGAGKVTRDAIEAIHASLRNKLALDDVRVCYHTEPQNCDCRKPRPGMILSASRELGIDVAQSFVVGDRWRDVGAAQAAGCQAIWIDYGYTEKTPEKPYVAVKSLPEAARFILRSK